MADATRSGELRARPGSATAVGPELARDFEALRAEVSLDVEDGTVLDVLVAWSQLFGLVSFEVFGQTRGVVEHHAELFEASVRRLADLIGLDGDR